MALQIPYERVKRSLAHLRKAHRQLMLLALAVREAHIQAKSVDLFALRIKLEECAEAHELVIRALRAVSTKQLLSEAHKRRGRPNMPTVNHRGKPNDASYRKHGVIDQRSRKD